MATTNKGIYYPNDYSNVADVPEDMKKLAESVDTQISNLDTNKVDKVNGKGLSTNDYTNEDKAKLDSLENYDDTEIKQDIEDIQEEQAKQNEDIEDLKQINAKQDDLIQKLKDNCINVTTEEATSLHVTDASTVPAKLEVRGNQRQATREGYNLLKITKENQSYYGVTMTINKDKSVSFKGTSTSTTGEFALVGNTEFSVDDFPYGEQLTFSCKGLVDGVEFAIAESDINGSWLRNLVVLNSSSPTKQATVSKGENASYIRAAYTVTTGKTFSNVITYPMIYKGTEGKPFESYGASPSPDYPSEVEAVGDNVNILPINTEYFEITENGIKNKDSSTGKTITEFTIKKGQTIKIGFIAFTKPSENTTFTCQINDMENSSLNIARFNNFNLNQKYEFSYTAVEDVVFKYVLNGNSANEIFEFQLWAQINELSNYSKYGQGSVEIKKINKNFYKLDIEGVSRSGVDYTTRNGTVTAKRTATAESGSYFNTNRTKLPAGTYVISGVDDTFVYANARIEVYTSDTIDGNATQITTLMNTRLSYKYTSDKPFYLSFSFVVTGETDVNDTFIFKPQAEKNDNDTASTFVEHQEQSYVLPIQQPMLQGDYFVKEADGWKEVHNWKKVVFTGNENSWSWNTDNFQRVSINVANGLNNPSRQMIYSNNFIYGASGDNVGIGFLYASRLYLYYPENITSLEDWKALLQEKYNSGNPVYVYYPLATSTKLPCTEAQSNVLDQLNELELFKGTNNIITAESLALMQMQYIADTQSYIDSKLSNINQQILEIAGGN